MSKVLRRINPSALAVIVGILALWQVTISSGWLEFDYFPSPREVLNAFGDLYELGTLWSALFHTLTVAFIAAVIAIVLGVLLGFCTALFPWFRAYTMGSIDVLRTLPVVALMPVVMLIWGPTTQSEIIIASYSSLWAVLINVDGGVSSVSSRLVEVARVFRLSTLDRYRKIIFPAAVPSILVGARLAIVHAVLVTIVAEIILVPQGLGGELKAAQDGLQPAQMWAWVLIAGVLGYVLNGLLVAGVRRAMPGGASLGDNVGAKR